MKFASLCEIYTKATLRAGIYVHFCALSFLSQTQPTLQCEHTLAYIQYSVA